jgi:hypothetical protein
LKDYLSPNSSREEIHNFFDRLQKSEDSFLNQEEAKKKGIIPVFSKSQTYKAIVYKEVRYHHILRNMLEQTSQLKVIGLIRNPMATIHSWLNAPREFRKDKGWKIQDEWRFAPKKNQGRPEEFNGYEKWKEVAYLFEELKTEYENRFLLVTYNDLLYNTAAEVERVFYFSGLEVSKQTLEFLKESRNKEVKDAYGVYKSKRKDDAWNGNLDRFIVQFIEQDLQDTVLEKYLK